jgi:hypothetical protein
VSTLRERRTDVVTRALGLVAYWHAAVLDAHFDDDAQLLAERLEHYKAAVQRLDHALVRLKALPSPQRAPHRRPNRHSKDT